MSDLSTLKNYLASIYAEKRAYRASIPQTSYLRYWQTKRIATLLAIRIERSDP